MKGTEAVFETKNCTAVQFEMVKQFLLEFELDAREILQHQFITLYKGNNLLGFGRIREHNGCSEMCSLGVLKNERLRGFGKQLIQSLIEKATQPIYLVCVIPTFFMPFGFFICADYPREIQDKLDYCNNTLSVNENYFVMTRNSSPKSHLPIGC